MQRKEIAWTIIAAQAMVICALKIIAKTIPVDREMAGLFVILLFAIPAAPFVMIVVCCKQKPIRGWWLMVPLSFWLSLWGFYIWWIVSTVTQYIPGR